MKSLFDGWKCCKNINLNGHTIFSFSGRQLKDLLMLWKVGIPLLPCCDLNIEKASVEYNFLISKHTKSGQYQSLESEWRNYEEEGRRQRWRQWWRQQRWRQQQRRWWQLWRFGEDLQSWPLMTARKKRKHFLESKNIFLFPHSIMEGTGTFVQNMLLKNDFNHLKNLSHAYGIIDLDCSQTNPIEWLYFMYLQYSIIYFYEFLYFYTYEKYFVNKMFLRIKDSSNVHSSFKLFQFYFVYLHCSIIYFYEFLYVWQVFCEHNVFKNQRFKYRPFQLYFFGISKCSWNKMHSLLICLNEKKSYPNFFCCPQSFMCVHVILPLITFL